MYAEYFEYKANEIKLTNEDSISDALNKMNASLTNLNCESPIRKLAIWDYELMSCGENYYQSKNLEPKGLVNYLEFDGGRKFPDIDNFEIERLDFYEKCFKNTDNISMKIRYLNYLVDFSKEKYVYAKELCGILSEYINLNMDDYKIIGLSSRLVDISIRYSFIESIKKVQQLLTNLIDKFLLAPNQNPVFNYFYLFRKSSFIKRNWNIENQTINDMLIKMNASIDYFKSSNLYAICQSCCWEICEWYKLLGNQEKQDETILKIGELYELEADFQQGRHGKTYHYKAHYLELAIQHYINYGCRQKAHDLKVLLKESYELGYLNSEISTHNFTIPNFANIDAESMAFIKNGLEDGFNNFCKFLKLSIENDNDKLFPSLSKSTAHAEKRLQEFPFWRFVSFTKMRYNRKVFEARTEEETLKCLSYDNYGTRLQAAIVIFYEHVMNKLINIGLTHEFLSEKINSWKYMSTDNKAVISIGIERFLAGDYISSLHILAPRFESAFRDYFAFGGFPTTSVKSNITQHEQNFSDFILNDFVKDNINPNFLFLIKYVMLDDLGYNLRNGIAHGLTDLETFNKTINQIVILCILILVQYEWSFDE